MTNSNSIAVNSSNNNSDTSNLNGATMKATTNSAALLPVFDGIFKSILEAVKVDDAALAKAREYFNKFRLLTFREPTPFKPAEIVIDNTRLNDPAYRRWLVRKLKAPRPSSHIYHTLGMSREQLADNAYLDALSNFMAQMTVDRLGELASHHERILSQVNSDTFSRFIEHSKLYELTAEALSDYILLRFCQDAVENNARFKEACALISEAGAEARATLRSEMEVVRAAAMAEFTANMDGVLAGINAQVDDYLAELHARQAERAAVEKIEEDKRAALAALNFGKSEQQIFAESVKKREIEHRLANPIHPGCKVLLWAGAVAFAGVVIFFAEVDGTTLAQYLNWVK